MAFPKIGNLAPLFSLPNQDGRIISLKDFRDRKTVVLYFYPAAMTPGCTTQACGLRDSAAQLAKLDAVVLGVSKDLPAKLLRFRERDQLDFDLLSDPDHAVCGKYGAWAEEIHGAYLRRYPAHDVHNRQGRTAAPRDGQGQDQDAPRGCAGVAAQPRLILPSRNREILRMTGWRDAI